MTRAAFVVNVSAVIFIGTSWESTFGNKFDKFWFAPILIFSCYEKNVDVIVNIN